MADRKPIVLNAGAYEQIQSADSFIVPNQITIDAGTTAFTALPILTVVHAKGANFEIKTPATSTAGEDSMHIRVRAGDVTTSDSAIVIAGDAELAAGNATASAQGYGGTARIYGGNSSGDGTGGMVWINAGSGGGSAGLGGKSLLQAGGGGAGANGGEVEIAGGEGGSGANGGRVYLRGGNGYTTSGGILIVSGNLLGEPASGNSGAVDIRSANAGTGGNSGNVTLRTGTSTATVGTIRFQTNGANTRATVSDTGLSVTGTTTSSGSFIAGTATDSITTASGISLAITTGATASATSDGNSISLTSGPGGGTSGNSGGISFATGTVTSGNTGSITFNTPSPVGTDKNAGDIFFDLGTPTGNGAGGRFRVRVGTDKLVAYFDRAQTILQGPNGAGSGGKNITVKGGLGDANFAGGNAYVGGGNGGDNSAGGDAFLYGGDAGGGGAGGGGNVYIYAGAAAWGGGSGPGGSVNITASAGTGTNQNGGSVAFTAGSATGSGTPGSIPFYTNGATKRLEIIGNGSVVHGNGALATNATDGFLYVAGSAGTPAGTPTAFTGRVPLTFDTTNNLLYFYTNGQWRAPSGGGMADPGSNGIVVRTALNTTTARTLTGTSNQITVTNGDGTAGNPTLSVPNTFVAPGTIQSTGALINNTGALATNATDGFLYVAGSAGTPAGTPTALTGRVPLTFDTTNNTLYYYTNGQWRTPGTGAGAPTSAQYVVVALDGTLTNERVLTGTSNQISITDGGANGNITLSIPNSFIAPGTITATTSVSSSTYTSSAGITMQPGGAGAALQLRGGDNGGTGTSGAVTIFSGVPSDGNSGGVTIRTENAVGTNRSSGSILLYTGTATGSGTVGNLTLQTAAQDRIVLNGNGNITVAPGAAATTTSAGATVTVTGGTGGASSGAGGNVTISGGASSSANSGGFLSLNGGAAGSGQGGGVQITAAAGAGASGQGGQVTIAAGNAAGSGNGGSLSFTGGSSSSAVNSGTITFTSYNDVSFSVGHPTPATALTIKQSGSTVLGSAALATNATNGFLYVAGMAGAPVGTPTAFTGRVPITVDTTNNAIYYYTNSAWRVAGGGIGDPGGNGIVVRTALNTTTARSLAQPAAGLTITNADGTAGNPTFALANDLSALEGLGSTGIAVRTAADTWAQRSIAGTTNQITLTNGDGVAGNPTVSIPSTFVAPGTVQATGSFIVGTGTNGITSATDTVLSIQPGAATPSSTGKSLTLTGGTGGSGGAAGGVVSITGGVGDTDGPGGAVNITGGTGVGTFGGGALLFVGGIGPSGQPGGAATLRGGASTTAAAGSVNIEGGSASSSGTGGSVALKGGTTSGGTAGSVTVETAGTLRTTFAANGDIVLGNAALATNATTGFLWVAGSAGTPTGVPAGSYTGRAPVTIDTTNNLLYFYTNGQWRQPGGSSAPVGAQYVVVALDGTLTSERVLTGTANQITFTDGGANGNITAAIASNPTIPGTDSMITPSGTSAQRSTAADGKLRFNTDTNCMEAGLTYAAGNVASWAGYQRAMTHRQRIWLKDEFMTQITATTGVHVVGELGWSLTGAGTNTNAIQASATDHPGIVRLTCGTVSGNESRIHLGTAVTSSVIVANQVEYFAFLIRIPDITTVDLKWGLLQDVSNVTQGQAGTDGVWFEFFPAANAAIRFYTRSGGTSSTPTSTVTAVANTWYLCEAAYDGTTWTPRVNGTSYTGIATNIPTVAVNVGAYVETLTGAARSLDLDYFALISRELGNRY